jgi:hypothetical protein
MALTITLPLGNKNDLKNLVFSILTKESPLKIIALTKYIRKRYGRGVTYQAVRKAVLQLVEDKVLVQKDLKYVINKDWVIEAKKRLDEIYQDITKATITPSSVDSIKGEVSVFEFNSPNKMMKFWEDLIDDWFENFKKGDPNINCYQGAHGWEGLLHADREKNMMSQLKSKKIKSYVLSVGNTPLDRSIWRFYKSIGIKIGFDPSNSSFDKSYYVATYGEIIVQTTYPPEIVHALDDFFKQNKSIEKMNLKELSDIVNKKIKVKLTVIKNLSMAKQINKSIIEKIV